jgi:hypothetical protein
MRAMCKKRVQPAGASIVLAILEICLACNAPEAPPPKNLTVETTATIDLKAVTNVSESDVFHEVRHVSWIPSVVLDEFGEIADPGEPFNLGDSGDRRSPGRQLIVAAVSEKFCILSYSEGGIVFTPLQTRVFGLSKGKVVREWVSIGGGLNFRDLKATVESGRFLKFQAVPLGIQRQHMVDTSDAKSIM